MLRFIIAFVICHRIYLTLKLAYVNKLNLIFKMDDSAGIKLEIV